MDTKTQTNTSNVAIESLFKAGAHFAFSKARRHPSAKPFIFGAKNKIEIFDLEKTSLKLEKAKEFIKSLGTNSSQILFVGGKSEAKKAVADISSTLNLPYVAGRFVGGTLTNFPEIRKRINKLETLLSQKEKGELGKYTKKERLLIDREIAKLQEKFSGIVSMKDMPKAVFIVDSKREHIALKEAKDNNIPIVAICGSDCDLGEVDYAIPANDASMHSVAYILSEIAAAYKAGQTEKKAV
jgi:small subunit ribosomal protein S2